MDVTGSISVSPAETTAYTITATGPGGTATHTITVTIKHGVIDEAKITASDAAEDHHFGGAVSMSDGYAIVGAYANNSSYIFKRDNGVWSEQAKLTPGDASERIFFGEPVSLYGEYAIVGAPWDDDGGIATGSAYIFKREDDVWNEQVKLTAGDAAAYDHFGTSVSLSGEYAIVGASGNDEVGSAYIFKRVGESWIEMAKLTAGDASGGDSFGSSVSFSGEYAIVGASSSGDAGMYSGSAYIFKRVGGSWTEMAKLTAGDAAEWDHFGTSVSLDGEYAIVGARYNDDGASNSGSAYIFKRFDESWSEQAKLIPGEAIEGQNFGGSVSILGDSAIVGAPYDEYSGSNPGSAYIFKRVGESWTEMTKLTPANAINYQKFGTSVSFGGDSVIVGAPLDDEYGNRAGAAYIYRFIAVNLTADPEIIQAIGDSATLSWTSTHADSVTIDNGIGVVPLNGSITVSPAETTTYLITATGPIGTATDAVTVSYPLPTVDISVAPEAIHPGQSSTLSWSSTNAVSASIDQGISDVSVNGSISVSPTETTPYTITVKGLGGDLAVETVTVTVNQMAPSEVVYEYDTLGRIKKETGMSEGDSVYETEYGYDNSGNRTVKQIRQ